MDLSFYFVVACSDAGGNDRIEISRSICIAALATIFRSIPKPSAQYPVQSCGDMHAVRCVYLSTNPRIPPALATQHSCSICICEGCTCQHSLKSAPPSSKTHKIPQNALTIPFPLKTNFFLYNGPPLPNRHRNRHPPTNHLPHLNLLHLPQQPHLVPALSPPNNHLPRLAEIRARLAFDLDRGV